jgi:addiction module HigA family antidote
MGPPDFLVAEAGQPANRIGEFMSETFNLVHPERVLKNTVCREDGGMSVTEFAKRLKVSRVTLSRVLNGHAGVSAELAIRLEAALGSSAQMWVGIICGGTDW